MHMHKHLHVHAVHVMSTRAVIACAYADMRTCMHIYICLKLFAEHCACASPSTIPHPTRLSPDQEIDDFAVAQSTPLPECIAGCEGDTVRRPSFTVPTFIQHSHRSSVSACPPPSYQGGETYAEGFGITILIPKNFRHESFEAEEAAKELTIKATEAKAEAKDEAKEAAEQTAKKSAAAKQAGPKQKIKKQAAAAKKVAPASTPVTASPHLPC